MVKLYGIPSGYGASADLEFALPLDAEVKDLPWPDWHVGTIVEIDGEHCVVMRFPRYGGYEAREHKRVVRLDRRDQTGRLEPTIREFHEANEGKYRLVYSPTKDLG